MSSVVIGMDSHAVDRSVPFRVRRSPSARTGRHSPHGRVGSVSGTSYLYERGVRDCAIDWTSLVDFYGRLGYQPWKQYYILQKDAV